MTFPAPEIFLETSGLTIFEVGNTWTRVYAVPEHLARLIDHFTKYPTPVAFAQSGGWQPPEAALGDAHWDGWIHLARFPRSGPGSIPTGLLRLCTWVCERYGYPYQIDDVRERPDEGIPDVFEPLVDRDYQLRAVELAVEEGRGVLDMPPRCHHEDDEVLLASGRVVAAKEVPLGGELLGPDGTVRKVLERHTGWAQLYRVTPRFAPPFVVTGNHVLVVAHSGIEVEVTVEHWLTWPQHAQDESRVCHVRQCLEGPRGSDPDLLPFIVEPIGGGPFVGWTVDKDHRYLSGGFVVQHNSGKTRTMGEIHRRIALPTLWIAPTSNVVKQTVRMLEEYFGKHYAGHVVGTKSWEEHQHLKVVCCTAATARKLPPKFFATREMLVLDEFHHSAAQTYHDIAAKCPHIFYRFGMTGTFFRSGEDALAMHAILSRTIYKVTTSELLELGHLVPTDVAFIPVDGPRAKGGPTFMAGCGKYGIYQHDRRNELVAWAAELLHFVGRKVLVLVGTKHQGYAVLELLKHKFPSGKVEFVSTDRPQAVCQELIDTFAQTDQIQVLIGTSMVGEGTDLPPADALVYAAGQKAEVALVQAAYRVCTATEGKKRAILVDFSDRHHRTLLNHSLERLRVFWTEDTFEVSVLDSPEQFSAWVEKTVR